jgi:hypothetical protein
MMEKKAVVEPGTTPSLVNSSIKEAMNAEDKKFLDVVGGPAAEAAIKELDDDPTKRMAEGGCSKPGCCQH